MIILFSGYNQRAVISFLRTLKQRNVPFCIIALSITDTIFKTEYKKNVVAVRRTAVLDLEDMLGSISAVQKIFQAGTYIIAPTSEALNRFLLENRAKFEQLQCIIPLVEKELYNTISDKLSFGCLCKEHNIDIPNEYSYPSGILFPCVAKPKQYFSLNNGSIPTTTILNDAAEFDGFVQSHNPEDFYFQEKVSGSNFYLLYYITKDKKIYKYSQENLVQQPYGKSIIAAVSSTVHTHEISEHYEKMLLEIGFRGLIMIDVFQTESRMPMIEANPRLWGPSHLFVSGQVNLFDAFLYDYGLIPAMPENNTVQEGKKYYFNYDALLEVLINGKSMKYHRYDPEQFCDNFHTFLTSAVYNADDTIELFRDADQLMNSLMERNR